MIFLEKDEARALRKSLRLLKIDKKWFALSVLFGSLGLGAAVALGATSAWLIARASQMPPVLTLSVAATAVRLFGISRAVLRYLERLSSHWVALSGMGSLRSGVYERLAESSTSKVAGIKRGDLLARTGADVDAVGDFVVKSLLPTAVALVVGVCTCLGIALLDPACAVVLAICLLLSGFVSPLLSARAPRRAELANQISRTEMSVSAMTMLDGAAELAVLGRTDAMDAHFVKTDEALTKAKNQAAYPNGWASAMNDVATSLSVIGAIIFGTWAMHASTLSPVGLAVVVLTPLSAFEGTALLGPATVQLISSAGAAKRIISLLDGEQDTEKDSTIQVKSNVLKATDLAIGWPGGPTIATGINLTLTPSSRTAIVGPSGIGKSTLLFTLAGLLEPKSGTVEIDGVPVRSLSRQNASKAITVTAEDAHIFETTVLENIRVARGDVTETEAYDLLDRAGIGEWARSLPEGLDTVIGSGGTTISGGERRRILIARALAATAPLMLLDEPGEHIDPATADKILTEMLTSQSDKGVLVVTHRLSALGAADEVLMMATDGGAAKVVARGRHQELLANNEDYAWAACQEEYAYGN